MLSLETHPDAALQAQVDARVRALAAARRARGNGGFEVAATCFTATGSAICSTPAIASADALYDDFNARQSAVLRRRARRDQLRAALSRHARQEASRSREALPRHPRPREFRQPQPAQPVLQAGARAERGRRPRGQLRRR